MKLGSLFDGSGGFPLAGVINDIEPVWASEIEAYPLKVTAARFPHMKQLGDVKNINGAEIEPVDIITFGSPCQDLSVAGKQAGIHSGERSNLFFEAIRIIKEMRSKTNGKYPRFALWENVPGAFSSNKGEDFRSVLQSFASVCGCDVPIPRPQKKWSKRGGLAGNGWSVAWRTYNSQYWGVPQRRKRIYLVADFASECAPEILFEREGVSGDFEESREKREGTAADAERSAGGSDRVKCLNPWDAEGKRVFDVDGCMQTLFAGEDGHLRGVCYNANINNNTHNTINCLNPWDVQSKHIVIPDGVSETLCAAEKRWTGMPPNVCYAIKGNYIDRDTKQNGVGWRDNVIYTLDATDRHAVALDCRNLVAIPELSSTLQAKPNGGQSLNYQNPVVYDDRGNGDGDISPTLTGDHQNRITDYTAICVGNGQLHQTDMGDKTGALNCMHDQQAIIHKSDPPRKYIIRRLTPLECCRLQGFPDWWEDGVDGSDTARYKMWGNGIALPCAVDVLERIAKALR